MSAQPSLIYDTHAAVRRLTDTGMPPPQAEGVVQEYVLLLNHNLATKADIEALQETTKTQMEALQETTKSEIEALQKTTKSEIEALQKTTKADIEALQKTTQAEIEALRQSTQADIAVAKNDTIKWLTGVIIAVNGLMASVIIAAIKFM